MLVNKGAVPFFQTTGLEVSRDPRYGNLRELEAFDAALRAASVREWTLIAAGRHEDGVQSTFILPDGRQVTVEGFYGIQAVMESRLSFAGEIVGRCSVGHITGHYDIHVSDVEYHRQHRDKI